MRKTNDNEILQMLKEGKSQREIARHFNVSDVAIHKRLKRLEVIAPPESLKALTPKQQKFALEIAQGKTQTQAALSSFECGSMDSAKSLGHNLMKDPDIKTAISDLMASEGLSRRYRIQRLKSCIDSKDPGIVLKGLDQSWKLENLYQDQPLNVGLSFTQLIVEGMKKTIDEMPKENIVDVEPSSKTLAPRVKE